MIAIFSTVIPVAVIVAIGFLVGKTLLLDLPTLSRLSIYVLLPALIAYKMYRNTLTLDDCLGLIVGCVLTYGLMFLTAMVLGRGLGNTVQKSLVLTSVMPNAGNMGLAVVLFTLGEPGLDRAIIYLLTSNILLFSITPAFLKGGGWRPGLSLTLKLPLVWAIPVGFALRLFGTSLPLKLDAGLEILAAAATPVAILILGIQIARSPLKFSLYEGGASVLRLLGGAIIAYVVGKALGLGTLDLQVLVLQSAMPAAIVTFLIAQEFGGDAPRTVRVVVVSTLLSFLTLPLVLFVLSA